MTDIHSHVLWGVDDGSGSLEESLAMLAAATAGGTSAMVATPHANPRFPFRREAVLEKIAVLAEAAPGGPKIYPGCEFLLSFDNLDQLSGDSRKYTINGTQYLLVECPQFEVGPHTEKQLGGMVEAGLVPIIAHPERNPLLRRKLARVESWVEMGCLLQLTALSLTGKFGGEARSASRRLLDRGLAHLVSSDAHDALHRPPGMAEARRLVQAGWGEDAAAILFEENPRAVVEGRPVAGGKQAAWRRAKWYEFWKK